MIDLIPVDSSMIKKVGYDSKEQVLRVVFNNNVVWDYTDTSQEEFENFKNAKSVGKHFHKYIKPIKDGEKVEL